jgi:outer membrane protein, multidrug efflux system
MSINKKLLTYSIIAGALSWSACKAPEKIYSSADAKVPEKYDRQYDTSEVEIANWRLFFKDTNLVALMNTALENNFDLLTAQQKVEIAGNNLMRSKGRQSPSLGINTFGSNTKYGRHTMDGAGNATTPEVPSPIVPSYMLGVSSSWEADIWGKLRNEKRAAQMRFLSTKMGRNLVVTSLLSEIAYQYYELISLDLELNVIERNIKLQEAALEVVRVQKLAGRATELAVKQFLAQLLHTQSLEAQTKQEIVRVSNEINFLTGRYADDIKRDTSIFKQPLPQIAKTGVPAAILTSRPDIIQAEMELKATKCDIDAARAAFLPSLTISAHAGYNTYHPELLFDPVSMAFGFIGTLSGPLINRKFFKANYATAIATNKEAYYQYSKSVMGAVYEVKTNLKKIDNLQKQYSLNEREAATLTEAIDIAKDLYIAGYANYMEVITAQKNAVDASLKVVKTRKDLYVGAVDLYRALGGGWQ